MRYDHHGDPAIAFCCECDEIEAVFHDVTIGLVDRSALETRVEMAMQFRVGGDRYAIHAKDRLREIEAALLGRKTYAEVRVAQTEGGSDGPR